MHTLTLMSGTKATGANVTGTGTLSGPGTRGTNVGTRTKVAGPEGLQTSQTSQETGLAKRLAVAQGLQTARASLRSCQWVSVLGRRAPRPLARPMTGWTTQGRASSSSGVAGSLRGQPVWMPVSRSTASLGRRLRRCALSVGSVTLTTVPCVPLQLRRGTPPRRTNFTTSQTTFMSYVASWFSDRGRPWLPAW